MPVTEKVRYWKAGCSESCPSGLEGAGRKRTPARKQRAALPPYAIKMLSETHDLALVQDLLGHASPAATRVYAKISPEDLKRAHKKVWESEGSASPGDARMDPTDH